MILIIFLALITQNLNSPDFTPNRGSYRKESQFGRLSCSETVPSIATVCQDVLLSSPQHELQSELFKGDCIRVVYLWKRYRAYQAGC